MHEREEQFAKSVMVSLLMRGYSALTVGRSHLLSVSIARRISPGKEYNATHVRKRRRRTRRSTSKTQVGSLKCYSASLASKAEQLVGF